MVECERERARNVETMARTEILIKQVIVQMMHQLPELHNTKPSSPTPPKPRFSN